MVQKCIELAILLDICADKEVPDLVTKHRQDNEVVDVAVERVHASIPQSIDISSKSKPDGHAVVGEIEAGHSGHGLVANDFRLGLGQAGNAQQEEEDDESDK